MRRPTPRPRCMPRARASARLVELSAAGDWRALDIATGAGHTAAAFAPHVARVIASDLTAEMWAEAGKLATAKGFANMDDGARRCRGAAVRGCAASTRHLPHRPAPLPRRADVRGRGPARAGAGRHVRRGRQHLARSGLDARLLQPDLRDASLTYNAFEKIRDPSHGRCLGMAEWSEVIEDPASSPCTPSACPRTWSSSRGPSAWGPTPPRSSACAPCSTALAGAAGLPEAAPGGGQLWFTLDEAIVIARKPASQWRRGRWLLEAMVPRSCLEVELLTRLGYKPPMSHRLHTLIAANYRPGCLRAPVCVPFRDHVQGTPHAIRALPPPAPCAACQPDTVRAYFFVTAPADPGCCRA